jgi:uncharacterized membrane protein
LLLAFAQAQSKNADVKIAKCIYLGMLIFILNIPHYFKIYCPIHAWCSNFVSLTVIIHTCLF